MTTTYTPTTQPLQSPEDCGFETIMEPTRAKEALAQATAKNSDGTYKYPHIALDFETTSLRPSDGYVRLTVLKTDDFHYVFDHAFCGSFESLCPLFIGPAYIAFYHQFEMRWFDEYCYREATIYDVGIMKKVVRGGGTYGLAQMARYDLKVYMSKDLQMSGWDRPTLSRAQYEYNAYDGEVTWDLFKLWFSKMNAGHWRGFHNINDAARGNMEMEDTGMLLDVENHQKLVDMWELNRATAEWYLRKHTDESVITNLGSNKQVGEFLKTVYDKATIAAWPKTAKTEAMQIDKAALVTAANRSPYPLNRWLAALVIYRYYAKYLSTYGDTLLFKQRDDGKITYRLNLAAAKTTRYSSSKINIQNVPRKTAVRRSFKAAVPGNNIIVADYSGIEVRTIAELSGDKQLIRDTIYGNVHATGASLINNIHEDDFLEVLADKDHKLNAKYRGYRQVAKVFTFRLIYGAGVGALANSLHSTDEYAQEAVNAWAAKYPRAYGYREGVYSKMTGTGVIDVVDGSTIYVTKNDRAMPIAANYPVQAAAAKVMYRAIFHTHELMDEEQVDGTLCASVHDELLLQATPADSEIALDCLEEGMKRGWLDVFPNTDTHNLLESAIGDNWSCKA